MSMARFVSLLKSHTTKTAIDETNGVVTQMAAFPVVIRGSAEWIPGPE